MTLIDEAARLTTLANDASEAAEEGSADAALGVVLDQLTEIQSTVAYGILDPRWWQHVPEVERGAVRTAAKRAAAAARPLRTENDQVLAAYGRGDATIDRGALSALIRAFREYGSALRQAQDDVLRAWIERLWPSEKRAELEVHALVPETAAAAREILSVANGLAVNGEEARILDDDELARLHERLEAAAARAATLSNVPVPEAVVEFFTQIAELPVMPLSDVSIDVFAWLDEHDATRLFVLNRAEW